MVFQVLMPGRLIADGSITGPLLESSSQELV